MPTSDAITVGRVAGLETLLGCSISTTPITSLRQFSQIYCEMTGISAAELGDTPASVITAWVRDFFEALRAPPSSSAEFAGTIRPLTIPLLMMIEDALDKPFYGGADLDALATQLVCTKLCYGLTDDQMIDIRSMPYPEYTAHVWAPLRAALLAALLPAPEPADGEKNPSGV